MLKLAGLPLAICLASTLGAQANAVPGLDGRLSVVDNLSYYGRRGPTYPGGEVGMAMLNTMCNPGTVGIPWFAAMQANHPKFGFLITRESNGRMEQISDRSYVKHAFTSTNFSGACGTCNTPGGSTMGVHCSDTYGAGNNADRFYLGPPEELDPWLGTWNPIGSYFDRGDPAVGVSQQTDGVRSLTGAQVALFDAVKNRVTVKEQDLVTPGARYFYGIHLMHEGEPAANRGDNLASRGFTPSWNGSQWSLNNNNVPQQWGSILQHWTNSTLGGGGNGNDDGSFVVAVVVTGPVGGMYHYEYAIHNVDNNRGGASLRIPVDANATVANFGFRDIDGDPLNDWTAARVGTEIAFSASANNALNWNSIYNCWFDCSVAPSNGSVRVDEARLGNGLLTISVPARVPSGVPGAAVATVGTGCGTCFSSFYETFASGTFDLDNSSLTLSLQNGGYVAGPGTGTYVAPTGTNLGLSDDSETAVALPFALPYPGGSTTSLQVCSNGFISPVVGNGTAFTPDVNGFLAGQPRWAALWHDLLPGGSNNVYVDSSASMVRVTWLAVPSYGVTGSANTFQFQFLPNGTVHVIWGPTSHTGNDVITGFTTGNGAGDPTSRDISATLAAGFSTCPADINGMALSASNLPVLGTSISLTTSSIPAGVSFGALMASLVQAIPPLDLTLIGMPGCESHLVGPTPFQLFLAPGASHSTALAVPNNQALIGLPLVLQSVAFGTTLTPLGAVTSNGLAMTLGM